MPRSLFRLRHLPLLIALCAACAADEEGPSGAEIDRNDGAILAGDAGLGDAASAIDSGGAGTPGTDSGLGMDAGLALDAGLTRDAAPNDASTASSDARMSEPDATSAMRQDASLPDAQSGQADDAGASRDAGSLPFSQAFHIALRVHRESSGLSGAALASILEEVNEIWWKQAAVCFEVEVVRSAEVRRDGFDLWFHRSGLGCGASGNGVYCGDHDIHSLDAPSLGATNERIWDTRQDAARTSAHELGHGLNLDHYNGFADSNDSLMSSGRQGFKLHDSEITTARTRALAKALASSSTAPCAAIPVVD